MIKEINKSITLHVKRFDELSVEELYKLLRLRSAVFVVEQNCVYQDLDDDDQKALHLWITDAEDNIIAMARVCAAGTHMEEVSIGRVLSVQRRKGYGLMIVREAISAAIHYFHAATIDIEAQEYTRSLYEKLGFRQTSEMFMLDGIPHIKMTYRQ